MKKRSRRDAALAIAGAAAFFAIAFAPIPLAVKVVLALASLGVCGVGIAGYAKQPGYYGLVVFRGKNGFNIMRSLARKHPRFFSEMADFGLTLFFGIIYGFVLFRKKPLKLVAHAILLGFFAFGLQFYAPGMQDFKLLLSVISLFFGLAATFFIAVVFQAFHIAFNFQIATPGAMPAIPGLTIPLEAVISIIILMVVHEMSHGVLFFIEKLRVKSSGVLLFGFIPIGAFVEQDEKQFDKTPIQKRRRVLVAGSTANFVAALVFMVLVIPASIAYAGASGGLKIDSVLNSSSLYGVASPGEIITSVSGHAVMNSGDLSTALQQYNAGDTVAVQTDAGVRQAVLTEDKKLGITAYNAPAPGMETLQPVLGVLLSICNWTALLNLMVALFNVMPLFVTDGHIIIRDELIYRLGRKRAGTAKLIAKAIGIIFLVILLINFLPWFK